MLRQARVPVVWLAGHVPWNTVTLVDGVPHVTLQSLTETFKTHPEPAAAWGLLELGTSIAWRVHGRDPLSFSMPAAEAARRCRGSTPCQRWAPLIVRPKPRGRPRSSGRRAGAGARLVTVGLGTFGAPGRGEAGNLGGDAPVGGAGGLPALPASVHPEPRGPAAGFSP